jgi:hypothetical protein
MATPMICNKNLILGDKFLKSSSKPVKNKIEIEANRVIET